MFLAGRFRGQPNRIYTALRQCRDGFFVPSVVNSNHEEHRGHKDSQRANGTLLALHSIDCVFANFAVKNEDFTAKNAKIYAKDAKNNQGYLRHRVVVKRLC